MELIYFLLVFLVGLLICMVYTMVKYRHVLFKK
mgnify:CR=1 FL=1